MASVARVGIEKMYDDVVLPEYAHKGDSGMDIRAYFTDEFIDNYPIIAPGEGKKIIIRGLETVLIPTGIKVELPEGYEIQVRPRSGLALKQKLTVLNSPGTVDEKYRGEICVILTNISNEDQVITHGDRIAQIVLQSVPKILWKEIDKVGDTERGEGGLGSTGVQ